MVATRGQRAAAAEANFDLDEVAEAPSRLPNGTNSGYIHNASNNGIRLRKSNNNNNNNNNIQAEAEEEEEEANSVTAAEPESEFSKRRSYAILLLFALITYLAHPSHHHHDDDIPITLHTVFYYGWISAISTGLGVLPLCFVSKMNDYYMGLSNAVAAGMMCAASYSLFVEGCCFSDANDAASPSPTVRTIGGSVLGLLFLLGTKNFLDVHEEEVKFGSLQGADARKLVLVVFVMTLHSFSEGVGIGVSFGGEHGREFGKFISASLAVHNVPEGMAVAIALMPRRVSKATAAIWCVVTSLPQPIMAVPAFMFVHSFLPLLPVGLGFAAGAMVWVAFMELLVEAYEDTKDVAMTGLVSSVALGVMIYVQSSIE